MAGSLEPQDCYSASALMQLGGGGRELPEGNTQTNNGAMTDMASGQQVAVNSIDQNVSHLGEQVNAGLVAGVTWPLNIFELGQQ